MAVLPMLAVSFVMNIVAVIFIVCAAALTLVVLIQKGKGGGISSAFGGGMAGGLLGSKTGDFLTWLTIAMAGVFLVLAVAMAKYYKPGVSSFGADQQQTQQMPPQQLPPQQLPPQPQETPPGPEEAGEENAEANSLNQ